MQNLTTALNALENLTAEGSEWEISTDATDYLYEFPEDDNKGIAFILWNRFRNIQIMAVPNTSFENPNEVYKYVVNYFDCSISQIWWHPLEGIGKTALYDLGFVKKEILFSDTCSDKYRKKIIKKFPDWKPIYADH
jgi:hypothetical protein